MKCSNTPFSVYSNSFTLKWGNMTNIEFYCYVYLARSGKIMLLWVENVSIMTSLTRIAMWATIDRIIMYRISNKTLHKDFMSLCPYIL